MIDYQIGQIIRSRKVNYTRPRIAAMALVGLAFAFGLSRTGTTVTHTGVTEKPASVGTKGGHSGGAGVIRIGS